MAFEIFYVLSLRNIVGYNAHTHSSSASSAVFSSFDCRQNLCGVPWRLTCISYNRKIKIFMIKWHLWPCFLSDPRNQLRLFLVVFCSFVFCSFENNSCKCLTSPFEVDLCFSLYAVILHPQNHFKYTLCWMPFQNIINHMFLIFMWLKLT